MKNNSFSRFGIAAAAVAALCFATSAGAIEQYPPLRTGANTGVSPAPATKSPGASAAKLSDKDKAFMMNAAKGGMMEVEMGKQAAQNAQNADVKKFGNRMVTDHSKANAELMKLAKEEGVSLPGPKAAGKWKSDKDYMADMVKDHQQDLAEFQAEAKNGSDPDLKAWANKGAAMVSKHLALAQQTQSKLK
jgi:putative membrane protein